MPESTSSPHGTRSRYVAGCRCGECRGAHAAYMRVWKSEVQALEPGDQRHGTINGYSNYGCRCTPCRAVNAAKTHDHRARAS